jgi:hypothetical protein
VRCFHGLDTDVTIEILTKNIMYLKKFGNAILALGSELNGINQVHFT